MEKEDIEEQTGKGAVLGAGIGAVAGALAAKKGKRLAGAAKGAVGGAVVGGAGGALRARRMGAASRPQLALPDKSSIVRRRDEVIDAAYEAYKLFKEVEEQSYLQKVKQHSKEERSKATAGYKALGKAVKNAKN